MSDAALKYAERDVEDAVRTALIHCQQRRSVVQAGGHVGVFPHRLSAEFLNVYTFEPSAESFTRLSQRCASASNIFRYQAALGCERVPVRTIQQRRDGNMNREQHSGVTHVVTGGHVPTLMIDDLGLSDLDLIMLDVEGYELFALQGAAITLRHCSPTIVVELNGSAASLDISDDDVRGWLRLHSYEFVDRHRSDEVWRRR